MSQTYIGKEYWLQRSDIPCLHCKGDIPFRPIPLGIEEYSNGITTCCGFCSWPCARIYADLNYPSDMVEDLTTRIMRDFKASCDRDDDAEGWKYLQRFDRFSQVPRAPPCHEFEPYGTLTHAQFRRSWTSAPDPSLAQNMRGQCLAPAMQWGRDAVYPKGGTFGSSLDTWSKPRDEVPRCAMQSISVDGVIIGNEAVPVAEYTSPKPLHPRSQDAGPRAFGAESSHIVGFSTRRQYRPNVSMGTTSWPSTWVDLVPGSHS